MDWEFIEMFGYVEEPVLTDEDRRQQTREDWANTPDNVKYEVGAVR